MVCEKEIKKRKEVKRYVHEVRSSHILIPSSQEDKKLLMDPLNEMKSYMETKRKFQEMTHPSATPSTSGRSTTVLPVKSSEATAGDKLSHKSKKKKDKKKKEDKKRLLMEKMRAERKRREESERMKSEAVLKKHYRVTAATDEKEEEDTASTRYCTILHIMCYMLYVILFVGITINTIHIYLELNIKYLTY